MKQKRKDLTQWMSLPALLLYGLFFVYPLLKGIGMSMTDWDGMGEARFVGLANFARFFQDARAMGDIRTTLIYAAGSALLLNLVGLGYAFLMEKPFLYYAARQLGAEFFLGKWMSSYPATMAVLIFVNVWQYAGMTMIIYLAGLKSISGDIREAAVMDGANTWQRFTRVTLPLLMPSIRINVVTNIIGSLSVFDIIMALTEGGPGYSTESLSIYIMRMCYGSRTGYSTAVAMILFFIILLPVLVSLRLTREKE